MLYNQKTLQNLLCDIHYNGQDYVFYNMVYNILFDLLYMLYRYKQDV